MIACPKCGNLGSKHWRQCPQMNSQPVCLRCCMECGYYDPGNLFPCRYHIENPRPDYAGELYKLNNRIARKKEQIERFYRMNKPWVANRMEGELQLMYRDLKSLKEKKDEEDQRFSAKA